MMACLASYYFGFYTFAFYMLRYKQPLLKDKKYNDQDRIYHYKQL